jgi:hypothetical protein
MDTIDMNKKRLKWLGVLAVMVFALLGYILWPAFVTPTASGGPLSGRVIEDGSGQPIAGAIVLARWEGYVSHGTVCFHVESTITDAEGRYHIPAWKKKHMWGDTDDQRVYVRPHKAGYRWTNTHIKNELRSLALDNRTREQRLEYLRTLSPGCGSRDESEKNQLPLLRAVYEEAESIAVTKEDMRTLNGILFELESIELGGKVAQERFLKKARALN